MADASAKADVVPLLKWGAAVASFGTAISLVFPSHRLPGVWGVLNDVLGVTYTVAWSYSFYPQFLLNLKRRSVEGLSIEFQMLNLLGFTCYSAYNLSLFFVPPVRAQYRHKYSANIPVGLEDVTFSVHAALITAATLYQCIIFERGGQQFFTAIGSLATGVGVAAAAGFAVVGVAETARGGGGYEGAWLTWLNLLMLLSTIKLAVSLVKYVPQVIMNVRRKSTVGWSIHNVLLDFTGGFLSVAQLLMQCAVQHDWTQIAGNPVKFGLGFVSLFFDVIFMAQHYIIYDAADGEDESGPGPNAGGVLGEPTSSESAHLIDNVARSNQHSASEDEKRQAGSVLPNAESSQSGDV